MQGFYNCIPETMFHGFVPAVMWLQFIVQVMLFPMIKVLYFYISTSRSMCAVPNMAVFCSLLMSSSPVLLLRYFLNDFGMVTVARIIIIIIIIIIIAYYISYLQRRMQL
jgi:hypothetical protein